MEMQVLQHILRDLRNINWLFQSISQTQLHNDLRIRRSNITTHQQGFVIAIVAPRLHAFYFSLFSVHFHSI